MLGLGQWVSISVCMYQYLYFCIYLPTQAKFPYLYECLYIPISVSTQATFTSGTYIYGNLAWINTHIYIYRSIYRFLYIDIDMMPHLQEIEHKYLFFGILRESINIHHHYNGGIEWLPHPLSTWIDELQWIDGQNAWILPYPIVFQ